MFKQSVLVKDSLAQPGGASVDNSLLRLLPLVSFHVEPEVVLRFYLNRKLRGDCAVPLGGGQRGQSIPKERLGRPSGDGRDTPAPSPLALQKLVRINAAGKITVLRSSCPRARGKQSSDPETIERERGHLG